MSPSTVLTVVLLVITIITNNVSCEAMAASEPADVRSSSPDFQLLDCGKAGKCFYYTGKIKIAYDGKILSCIASLISTMFSTTLQVF